MRSRRQFIGTDRTLQRAWIKGAGFTDAELNRPLIAVVNTYQDFSPENVHLRVLADAVKAGIRMEGGTPAEFNAFHVTDSEAFAAASMRYVLPSRDVVADLVELMILGHGFDAMVLLGSGDKPTPGMVMAAARLDIPSILLYGGPTPYGRIGDKKIFLETVYDAVGERQRDIIDDQTLTCYENALFPGPGACDTATSGNTAGIYTEALGMSLPGSGTLAAGGNPQIRAAKETGRRILRLLEADIRPSKIITKDSLENAIRVAVSVSGSTNMVLHLIAIAKEAGVEGINFDTFDRIGRETPTLTKLAPSGNIGVTELGAAGGVPAVMKELKDLINGNCLTVCGKQVLELIKETATGDRAVIRSVREPMATDGSIYILKGTLAPDGAVVKASAVDPDMWSMRGTARVFEDEEDAIAAIRCQEIAERSVIIIRNEGPKGGPGMREMLGATSALVGMGLSKTCALVTDGRFSGASHGPAIGYVTPEAARGGPISLVEDGDVIVIDLHQRQLDLEVSPKELEARRAGYLPRPSRVSRGYLKHYADHVAPATEGAVMPR